MAGTSMAGNAPAGEANASVALRWYVLLIMMLAYTINIADRYVMSTVLEEIRVELHLSDGGVAFLTGVSLALFYVTMGIPLSWIADRSNRRNVLAISITLWSLMTTLCGLSRSYTTLLLARMGVGVGEAGGTPSCTSIICDYFPAARDYVAQMKFKPPPHLGDGFLMPDGVGDKETLVGRLFPQPIVRADDHDVLLDEVLGLGFAIVVRSPRPEMALTALAAKPWSDIAASILVFGRDVIELTPNPRLAQYNDHVILLRPDRYVAACIKVDELAAGGEKIAALLRATC